MDTLQRQRWSIKRIHLIILVLKQCGLFTTVLTAEEYLDFIMNARLNSTDCDVIEEFIQKLILTDLLLAKEGKQAHCYSV